MEKLVILGKGNPSNQNVSIAPNARARSTYVIGITGTGKSTTLESMAYQDIANGDGLCFLDPHGDSVKKLLASVPAFRESDVIFWDPSDIDRPFGFNPFYCSDPTNEAEVSHKAQSFIDALGSLKEFASIFESAPRMKNMLHQLATTFIINQGHTLAETPKFLLDQDYRQQFYPALSNRFARIRRYWEDELDARSERERREISESSLNKLERFQSDPVLYSIFGQPTNSIDFRKAMDSGKIILINLGADKSGFIGAFVVWELLQAALSRIDIPEQARRQFHIFADEFQTYMTTAFPRLQAEARKYGVDTVIAHQVRAQLTPEIAEITPAVGNLIIFRVTSHNAEALATEFNTTPPPPELVPQIITKPVYKSYTEIIWTPKEAEGEYNDLSTQLAKVQAEATRLAKALGARDLDELGWMMRVKVEDVYKQFNPLHWDSHVKEYVQNQLCHPNTYKLKKAGRQAHRFPISLTSEVEWRLEREKDESSATLLAEIRAVLNPLKAKAIYWYVPSNWEGPTKYEFLLNGLVENGKWEITPFPEMLQWLSSKASGIQKHINELKERQSKIWWACRKEVSKQRYDHDEPVRAPRDGSSPDQEVLTYRWVPGTPRQRSDVAAEIANQLTGLANFQAKVKLTQDKARATEHLVSMYDYPGIENKEVAQRVHERSREQYGRDRGAVERAIEVRLQVWRETSDDAGEPILREKTNTHKRLLKNSNNEESQGDQ